MSQRDRTHRVSIERIDWPSALPGVHLFQAFRMAIQPAKLCLALALVVLLILAGRGLDLLWGQPVQPGQFNTYATEHWPAAAAWARATGAAGPASHEPAAVFDTTLRLQTTAFRDLIAAATGLTTTATPWAAPGSWQATAHAAAIMLIVVPAWLVAHHPLFLTVFVILKLLLVALFGGAIARLAAVEASRDMRGSIPQGLRFAKTRYPWFILAPLIPAAVVAFIALLLALAGAALFNLPVTDILGAIALPLMLLGGLIMAIVLIGLSLGAHLLYPSIAVEGSDAFDAISRAFNYLFARPWRFLFYTAVIIIYGLVTFLFFALVVYLTLWLTHGAVGLWTGAQLAGGTTRFDAILPAPALHELFQPATWWARESTGSAGIAAGIAAVWVKLLIALLPAFLISYYFSANTWLYLLLRRAADGTEFDDLYLEEQKQDLDADTPAQ